ncbi:MAG: methionyl-tRNA formyltransferase [Alphaproteobacteria bacterium]|jgi:methionyl-tRNA formyltransferase
MRIAYMGTPDFAVSALAALIDAGHDIVCVYAQPPRPAGRGQKPRPSPVQKFAEDHDIEVRTPASLKDPTAQEAFAALDLDVAVIAAYGLILPKAILDAPRLGCVNIHASLLPRWRGAAPIQRAIEAGDPETGVSIMQMDKGLDTGGVVTMRPLPITVDTNAGELHDALAALGAEMIVPALAGLDNGSLAATPQSAEGVTYAAKIEKSDGRLDWRQPAPTLDRAIRAFTPWPGAWCELDGARVKILRATPLSGASDAPGIAPGVALDDQLTIACGDDSALRLERLQREGRKPANADAFLRGHPVPKGSPFT